MPSPVVEEWKMDNNLKKKKIFNSPNRVAWLFLVPSFLFIILFNFIPLFSAMAISTLNLNIFMKNVSFVGLGNYIKIISDPRFWNSLKNTLLFTVLEAPLQIGLALLVASVIHRNTRFKRLLRSFYYIPVVCSMTAMGILWSILLDPTLGYYSYIFKLLGINNALFLKSPATAIIWVVLITVWKNFGLTMMILIAGFQDIPYSYYEAAQIDGANAGQSFRYISLPLLKPSLAFCIVTVIIDCLKVFDQVYVMTQGGPLHSTETVVQYIYQKGFSIAPFNLGYASAVAEILFLIIAVVTYFLFKLLNRKEAVEY